MCSNWMCPTRGVYTTYPAAGNIPVSMAHSPASCITTECGLEGSGESTPFGATFIASHALGVRAGIAEITPRLIGFEPKRVDRINDVMDETLLSHEHAKAALDIACWDIFGKSTGLSVCELLGGRTDVNVPIVTSLLVRGPEGMRAHRAKGPRASP